MSSSADLLVRADAGPEIGGGHVMRCLALAQAARRRGGAVTLLTRPASAALLPRWRELGAEIVDLTAPPGSAEDAHVTAALARARAVAAIVLDGYRFDAAYRAALGGARPPLLVVDDLGGVELAPGDLLLNPALDASAASYGPHGQLLLGAAYALLRDELVIARAGATRVRPGDRVGKLVVTVGAGDPAGVTARILQALAALPAPAELVVTVVIGPDNPDQATLRALAAKHGLRADFVTAPRNMAPVLAAADAAVSAAGSTAWELAALGCPSLLLVLADNQRPNGESLAKRGACLLVDLTRAGDAEAELRSALRDLLGDSALRADLAARSRALVDGRGAERVLDALSHAKAKAHAPSLSPSSRHS